jgi:hypothetical protein
MAGGIMQSSFGLLAAPLQLTISIPVVAGTAILPRINGRNAEAAPVSLARATSNASIKPFHAALVDQRKPADSLRVMLADAQAALAKLRRAACITATRLPISRPFLGRV